MANMVEFPVELLVHIFQDLYDSSPIWEASIYFAKCCYSPLTWDDQKTRSCAEFPFNVAGVCDRWREVVLKFPEYWTLLVFDLAKDPEPLLGAFAASEDLPFSVEIFTTASDTSEIGKIQENNRARLIVQHLMPHLKRCISIVFDSKFASSLPSAVSILSWNPPGLAELILDYEIYDLPRCYKGSIVDTQPRPTSLKLTKMTMCGSAFMDLIHFGTDWLESVMPSTHNSYMRLHIRDFQFPAPNRHMIDEEYTFTKFIYLLHCFYPSGDLFLDNLSLSYRPHGLVELTGMSNLSGRQLNIVTFKDLSKDFLAEFFKVSALRRASDIAFIRCSIPPISGPRIPAIDLNLQEVPPSTAPILGDDSLYNILSAWHRPGVLTVQKCPTFNDEFIGWLGENGRGGDYEARGIITFAIHDCQNFTSGALRQFVAAINDPLRLGRNNRVDGDILEALSVSGRGPRLEDEDHAWFTNYKGETSISWKVKNEDGYNIDVTFSGT